MEYIDYSLIENQVGCGWCACEETCETCAEWKRVKHLIPYVERSKNGPSTACGKFIHYTTDKKYENQENYQSVQA
jgi:hypothetical protein